MVQYINLSKLWICESCASDIAMYLIIQLNSQLLYICVHEYTSQLNLGNQQSFEIRYHFNSSCHVSHIQYLAIAFSLLNFQVTAYVFTTFYYLSSRYICITLVCICSSLPLLQLAHQFKAFSYLAMYIVLFHCNVLHGYP